MDHASSLVLLPSAVIPWGVTVGGSCLSPQFEMCLYYFWKYGLTFLQNLSFLLRLRWILSLPQLLASSCLGSCGRVGGSAGPCLHPPASVAPDPQRLSG